MSITLTLHDPVEPAFAANINLIVFATDDAYVPYCGVAIASLIANACASQNYDIVILEELLSSKSKTELTALTQSRSNISIRFFNVQALIEEYKDFLYVSGHVSIATYYRFFIVRIFALYEKALYLDCDIIIDQDVSELTQIDLQDKLVAGVLDAILILKPAYTQDFLKLLMPAEYFNAGVLLFNLKELRKIPLLENCFATLRERDALRWHDQDIFNILFQGEVQFVSQKWNYITDLKAFGSSLEAGLSKELYQSIVQVEQDPHEAPYIIHFAGKKKPWYPLQAFLSERFWHYAEMTPFYSKLLNKALAEIPEALVKARKKIRGCTVLSLLTWGNTRKKYVARKIYYVDSVLATKRFAAKHLR